MSLALLQGVRIPLPFVVVLFNNKKVLGVRHPGRSPQLSVVPFGTSLGVILVLV